LQVLEIVISVNVVARTFGQTANMRRALSAWMSGLSSFLHVSWLPKHFEGIEGARGGFMSLDRMCTKPLVEVLPPINALPLETKKGIYYIRPIVNRTILPTVFTGGCQTPQKSKSTPALRRSAGVTVASTN
jgi:hypothetical protein